MLETLVPTEPLPLQNVKIPLHSVNNPSPNALSICEFKTEGSGMLPMKFGFPFPKSTFTSDHFEWHQTITKN